MIREERKTCQENSFWENLSDMGFTDAIHRHEHDHHPLTREELYENRGKQVQQGRFEIHSAV
jgi:hypothetical protein